MVTSGTALLVMAIFKWSYRDPSVRREPSKRTTASTVLGYSVLIMKSLSAADSAPQISPLGPASCRTLA